MNIVVVDGAHLAGEADFPMLDYPKYGWQQFPALSGDELAERCWRADVIISVDTPIDQSVIDKAFKLALIAVAGDDTSHIDMAAAQARGIAVCHVPGADSANPQQTAHICTQTIANIAAYLQNAPINLLRAGATTHA
jgi:phosphoglycerate dehydrogenase-like enzyme